MTEEKRYQNLMSDPGKAPPKTIFDEIIDRPSGMKGYIVNLTIEGAGLMRDGSTEFICRPGDMLLFAPQGAALLSHCP